MVLTSVVYTAPIMPSLSSARQLSLTALQMYSTYNMYIYIYKMLEDA